MDPLDFRLHFDPHPGTGPLMANCVFHADDVASMAIYTDHVYCFGCAQWTTPGRLLQELGSRTLETRRSMSRASIKDIPDSLVQTYHAWLMTGHFAARKEWLRARGLREETLERNKLGHCGNAFVIPVPGTDKPWACLRYRRDDVMREGGPKYWGTPGANTVMLYRPVGCEEGDTFLCEGELDALRLSQEGFRAVSLTNGCHALTPEHVPLLTKGKVIVTYDQDIPGRKAARRVVALLGEQATPVFWPEVLGKDVTEFLQRWPLEAFQRYVRQAQEHTHESPLHVER